MNKYKLAIISACVMRFFQIALIAIPLIIICFLAACIVPTLVINHQLAEMPTEAPTPAYVDYSFLHYDGQSIYLPQVLEENGIKGRIAQVLYTDSQRVWFSYIGDHREASNIWSIASVSLDGSNFKSHCSEQFQTTYAGPSTTGLGIGNENSGSFHNGKIVLSDAQSVLVYDVYAESYQIIPASDYIAPKPSVTATITEHRKIHLEWDGGNAVITPEMLAETSQAFSKLMEHDGKQIWSGESKTEFLFSGVQCIGDDVYIICGIMNYMGETFVFVFHYDYLNDICSYCFYKHNGDLYHGDIYVVPSK